MATDNTTVQNLPPDPRSLRYSPEERRIIEDYAKAQTELVNRTKDKLKRHYETQQLGRK